MTLNPSNGTVISGKKFDAAQLGEYSQLIMRSLLVNSQGNAAYALVYRVGKQPVILRTNPKIFSNTTDWALNFTGEPWGVVFGKTED